MNPEGGEPTTDQKLIPLHPLARHFLQSKHTRRTHAPIFTHELTPVVADREGNTYHLYTPLRKLTPYIAFLFHCGHTHGFMYIKQTLL